MSTVVFPTSIIPAYPALKVPKFRTEVIEFGNKNEQRISWDSTARYSYTIKYPPLGPADVNTVLSFFTARKGRYDSFRYRDQAEAYGGEVWSSSKAYAAGMVVRPTTYNEHSYICISSGVSSTSAPAFSTAFQSTVTDGTVEWREHSRQVRFTEDTGNYSYFEYRLTELSEISVIEVSS